MMAISCGCTPQREHVSKVSISGFTVSILRDRFVLVCKLTDKIFGQSNGTMLPVLHLYKKHICVIYNILMRGCQVQNKIPDRES